MNAEKTLEKIMAALGMERKPFDSEEVKVDLMDPEKPVEEAPSPEKEYVTKAELIGMMGEYNKKLEAILQVVEDKFGNDNSQEAEMSEQKAGIESIELSEVEVVSHTPEPERNPEALSGIPKGRSVQERVNNIIFNA
jgi:hypothetical protein